LSQALSRNGFRENKDRELPEGLVAVEKQTLSREVGEILSHCRWEEGRGGNRADGCSLPV